jgi:Ion transport protein
MAECSRNNIKLSITACEDPSENSFFNFVPSNHFKEPEENYLVRNFSYRSSEGPLDVSILSLHSNSLQKKLEFKHKAHILSTSEVLNNPSLKYEYLNLVLVCEKTLYEKIQQINDNLPCLDLRKAVFTILVSLRSGCKLLAKSPVFDFIIILAIFLNTLIIILESYLEYDFSSLEKTLLIIYTIEFGIKIIGLGIIGTKHSYFRDNWNILDFIVLVLGWLSEINKSYLNLYAARIIRILRIFRSISSVKGLRIILQALIGSSKRLISSLILLFLYCLIFAVGGVQLFSGQLSKKCMNFSTGIYSDEICGARSCEEDFVCVDSLDNPNFGYVSFDNSINALLVVFQCITLEGWSEIYEKTSNSFGVYAFAFFIPMTFIGAFILVSLVLAIIKIGFTKTMNSIKRIPVDVWNEETLLRESVAKKDGFLEIEMDDSSDFFNDIRNIQENITAHRMKPDENSDLSSDDPYPLLDNRRSSTFKQKTLYEGCDSTITGQKNTDSLFKTTIVPEIKTIVKIKANLLEKFRKGKHNHSFKLIIISENSIESISIEDLTDPCKEIEYFKQYKYSQYNFLYIINEQSHFQTSQAKNIEKYMEKYGNSQEVIFSILRGRKSSKESFFETILSVKKYISESKNQLKINQKVLGEWSGLDVSPNKNLDVSCYNFINYRIWSKGVSGKYEKIIFPIRNLVESDIFNKIMGLILFLNTVILSTYYYNIPKSLGNALDTSNELLTIIFVTELVIKLIGKGFKGYLSDYLNVFEVTISLMELVFTFGSASTITAFRSIRVFRAIRVLRVARMARYINSLFHIIKAISNSAWELLNLFILLMIFILIFTLLGLQIFAEKFNFREGLPRSNFDSFQSSFITIWQLISIKKWHEILYDGMRSSQGTYTFFFFIIWIIIGKFILLNVFLAIILDSFTEDAEKLVKNEKNNLKTNHNKELEITVQINRIQTFYTDISCEKSFWVCSKENKIRKLCYKISESGKFDKFVFIIIILSSIKLVWDTYIINSPSGSIESYISMYLDIVFTSIFIIEFLIKSITAGFLLDSRAYLRENWNKIDFFIIVMSIIDLCISSLSIPAIKVFRLLRTLRPLRLLSHNVSMKLVVNAMIESLASICNVVLVFLLFGLIFSILGVSLFGGMLYTCNNNHLDNEIDCISSGYQWVNSDYNFDNVLEAGITLFIVTSGDGWTDIMYSAMDTVAPGTAPKLNANPSAAFYFIIYLFISSFFLLNLFIAVIFEKFTEARLRETALIGQGLNKDQQLWIEMQRLILQSKPKIDSFKPPDNLIRQKIFYVITSTWFEWIMTLFIIANFMEMAAYYQSASSQYKIILKYLNLALSCVFVLEAIMKIAGMGFKRYFRKNTNKLDLFTVAISVIGIVSDLVPQFDASSATTISQLIRLIRVIRIIRVFKIINFIRSLGEILSIIGYSLPAILNVLSLLSLVFFIYAVLGVFTFGSVAIGQEVDGYFNFATFHNAMLTLYRISTGEQWYLIMYDCAKVVGKGIASFYFCSFVVLSSFLLMNLFIMVILQNYEEYEKNPESAVMLFNKHLKEFRRVWETYSFLYHGVKIHYNDLPQFMYGLSPALGLDRSVPRGKIMRMMVALRLDIDENGFIYYNDMLFVLLKKKYKQKKSGHGQATNIIEGHEKATLSALKKIQEKSKKKFLHQEKILDFKGFDLFLSLMYVNITFKSWKKYAQRNKKIFTVQESELYSESEFPGYNTINI